MNNEQQFHRALLLLGFLAVAFAGLGYRLVDWQVLRHDELSARAERNTLREFREAPRRGDILDVTGNILATSIPVKTVCADPTIISNQTVAVARLIAPLLQLDASAIAQKLVPRTFVLTNLAGLRVTNESHYVRLARNVPEATWQRIYAAMTNFTLATGGRKLTRKEGEFQYNLRFHSIYAESDQLRVYPCGSLASQVVGFPVIEETNVDGHFVAKIVGCDGIEKTMQKQLSGVAGWRLTEMDKAQHELVGLRDEDVYARDGLSVVLTIDSQVQHIVETALADAVLKHSPKGITGIVMRPRTGEILAMASLPTFDPGNPATITPETRNRVITDVMEPGSTFKIVVVSGSLDRGVLKLTDKFDCEHGHFSYGGRTLHDHEAFGILSAKEIITKSSNIGAAKIAIERLGAQQLYRYAWDFGFGQRTLIPLPGEARGILYPVKDWSKVTIAQMPMGHGVAVTRLQMLFAMAAIANHGWLMQPMIINRLQELDGKIVQRYEPQRVRQVISEAACEQMIEALKTVPTKEGTAPDAALKEYIVAGKTGTAQKAEHGGYAPGKYVSSFIGFFPADNPEICISVVMDEPRDGYYGGKVCGPVFRDIAERCASYLNILPDASLNTNLPPMMADVVLRK